MAVDELGLAGDDAERGVVVAGDALGGRVDHEVDAVVERALPERRGEGRVDHGDRARDGAELVEVDQRRCRGWPASRRRPAWSCPGRTAAASAPGSVPSTKRHVDAEARAHQPGTAGWCRRRVWRWATMWSPAEHSAEDRPCATAPMPEPNAERRLGALERRRRRPRTRRPSGCRSGSRSVGARRRRPAAAPRSTVVDHESRRGPQHRGQRRAVVAARPT